MMEKFRRFMMGRYGSDQLNRFLPGCACVLLIIAMFTNWFVLSWIAVVMIGWCYFRMFSKNHSKRYQENTVFLSYTNRLTGYFRGQRRILDERKDNHIYTCPNCKQKIRIPKGKGKIMVTCPKCHKEFSKKS